MSRIVNPDVMGKLDEILKARNRQDIQLEVEVQSAILFYMVPVLVDTGKLDPIEAGCAGPGAGVGSELCP